MPGGVYSALSGMQARLEDLDRLAGDLSNVNTPGFKTERATTEAVERNRFATMLESAVDVVKGERKVDFRAGTMLTTGRELDLAIEGSGFFVIDTPQGVRYTRAGNFTRRSDGVLTTPQGEPVLSDEFSEGSDPERAHIKIPPGASVEITEHGLIRSNGQVAGRIHRVDFGSEKELIKETGSRFRAADGAQISEAKGRIVSGALEQSNVSVVERMAVLTELSRNFESMQKGISVLMNDIDGRAISELGRR